MVLFCSCEHTAGSRASEAGQELSPELDVWAGVQSAMESLLSMHEVLVPVPALLK